MTATITVSVQTEDFDPAQLQSSLMADVGNAGALCTFIGLVRGADERGTLNWMELEHYPGMTEASLGDIAGQAADRWPLQAIGIVHRVGRLTPGERIVWVAAAAEHRGNSFAACEFIMDLLKTQAPFWKREQGDWGEAWVKSRDSDSQAADRWRVTNPNE